MGLYDRHILPHLIDFACGMGAVMKARSQLVPQARGRVLEIGIGSGLNLSLEASIRAGSQPLYGLAAEQF